MSNTLGSIRVLYEDNHVLVVVKPPNMPVQADDTNDLDVLSTLKLYIKEKYQKPGDVYLGLVHRLDRPVGGVMVFARTSKAAARLTDQFKSRTARKKYVALTGGSPLPFAKLNDYLVKDERTNTSYVVDEHEAGAKQAGLLYRFCGKKAGLSLLDVELFTGRSHQIRVQLAHQGLAIHGDARYNKDAKPGVQIALYAYSLTINHPTTKKELTFESFPSGGAWDMFDDELLSLSSNARIIFADDNIIAAVKPQGIAVADLDEPGGATLETTLREKLGYPVYPAHRLDVNTGGIVLFAKNEAALYELERAIRERSVKKLYMAIVRGKLDLKSDTLTAYISKDSEASRVYVHDTAGNANDKKIVTKYNVLSEKQGLSLVEVELVTGRTHQIRAHMAHIGHPIVGDEKYGDWDFNKSMGIFKQTLWACSVTLSFDSGILQYLDGRLFRAPAPFCV